MRAGRLDRRVQLFHKTLTRNGAGENVATYPTAYATVWAGKRDLRGRELFVAQETQAEATATWTMRWRDDVLATDRLIDDQGRIFDIAGPPAEIGRRQGLDLACRAVTP
jgi:SPP1 family predicted phage head-tail adaptor